MNQLHEELATPGPAGNSGPEPLLVPWLESRKEAFSGRDALISSDGALAMSAAEIKRRSARVAAGLSSLGLRPGDAIAVFLPNRPDWLLLHFAAARLGLLTIPINTWSKASEVQHYLSLGGCRAVFVDSAFKGIDFTGILAEANAALEDSGQATLEWLIEVGSEVGTGEIPGVERVGLKALEASSPQRAPQPDNANQRMIAFSTSGTTSLPKLAVHQESVLLSHARAVADRSAMTGDDVVLGALPPCGAYGYTLLMAAYSAGATAVMVEEYDTAKIVETIARYKVTMMALTEPLMRRLLDQASSNPEDLASLRLVFSAGGSLKSVVERAQSEFGFRVSNVYGSSEVLALAAFWGHGSDVEQRSAAGGQLVSPGMRVRVAGEEGGCLDTGAPGELQFKGPVLTTEYLGNPQATADAFTEDGWYRSQDLGCLPDESGERFLYISRLGDAMRLKGFLVNPGEIESMLQSHPDVAAAQVVAIPDGHGEELAAAFVILNQSAEVSSELLKAYCKQKMASYKVPSVLKVLQQFPMTRSANGDKVVKHKLRDLAREALKQ